MIEIPAAALAVGLFLRRLDFLSIGTNDLIQYTLAIDRSDEQVANLYDPLHPAVLMLLAHTLSMAEKVNIPVSVCGELAGDPQLTRLLLGMGLRIFSMHPSQILEVKSKVLKANVGELTPNVRRMLRLDEPGKLREALDKLNI
jgi:phosphotransferase system enzyme I (PtsI)